MAEKKRAFTSAINEKLLKDIKKLCIDLDRPLNDLLEESLKETMKKYQGKATSKK